MYILILYISNKNCCVSLILYDKMTTILPYRHRTLDYGLIDLSFTPNIYKILLCVYVYILKCVCYNEIKSIGDK